MKKMNNQTRVFTKTKVSAWANGLSIFGAALWHEHAAQEESSELIAAHIDNRVVEVELVLGFALPQISHVIREHGVVVGDLQKQPAQQAVD